MRAPVSSQSPSLRVFYPALDGVRAIAFLLVFFLHFGCLVWSWYPLRWGWVGVDLFFVLSGFLITGILYDSLHEPHFFRVFYIRRALRIFPLYYGFWLTLFLLTPLLHIVWKGLWPSLLYLGNWPWMAQIAPGGHAGAVPYFSLRHPGMARSISIGHFWSLFVEEQFYLAWPLVVWLVRSRKALLRICLAAFCVIPFITALAIHLRPDYLHETVIYASTLVRSGDLLFGAAFALWLRGPSPDFARMRRFALTAVVTAPLVLAVCLALENEPSFTTWQDPVVSVVGFPLISCVACAFIFFSIQDSAFSRALQNPTLMALGRISYGLYFFHGLLGDPAAGSVPWFRAHHLINLLPFLGLAVSIAMAWLSFNFYELPFLRLKSLLAPRRNGPVEPVPATRDMIPEYRQAA